MNRLDRFMRHELPSLVATRLAEATGSSRDAWRACASFATQFQLRDHSSTWVLTPVDAGLAVFTEVPAGARVWLTVSVDETMAVSALDELQRKSSEAAAIELPADASEWLAEL